MTENTKATTIIYTAEDNTIRVRYVGWTKDKKTKEGETVPDMVNVSLVSLKSLEKMPQQVRDLYALQAIVNEARDSDFIKDARGEDARKVFEAKLAEIVEGKHAPRLPTGKRAVSWLVPADQKMLSDAIAVAMPAQSVAAVERFIATQWPVGQPMTATATELVKRPQLQAALTKLLGTGEDDLTSFFEEEQAA